MTSYVIRSLSHCEYVTVGDLASTGLVALVRWMANNGYRADEIAYAVEKPWKYDREMRELH